MVDMDNLKAGWGVLNERLAQSEILNKRLIREMITKRTQSAHSKLFNFEIFSAVLVFAFIVMLLFIKMRTPAITTPSFILLACTMSIAFIIQSYLIYLLQGISIEFKGIIENTKLLLQYKLVAKRNIIYGSIFALFVVALFIVLQDAYYVFNVTNITLISIMLIVACFMGIIQYRFYMRTIASIQKGLDELRDFEQE